MSVSTLPLALQVVSQIMGANQGLAPLVGGGQREQAPPAQGIPMPQNSGSFAHPESPIMQQAINNQRPDMPPDGFANGGTVNMTGIPAPMSGILPPNSAFIPNNTQFFNPSAAISQRQEFAEGGELNIFEGLNDSTPKEGEGREFRINDLIRSLALQNPTYVPEEENTIISPEETAKFLKGAIGYAGGGGIAGMGRQYRPGGGKVVGPGDGMSDSVNAVIDNQEPAQIASGEHIIDASTVSDIGNGDSEAGHKKLYALTSNIRKARHGTTKQPPAINTGIANLVGMMNVRKR